MKEDLTEYWQMKQISMHIELETKRHIAHVFVKLSNINVLVFFQ
jgi:hypothetical protein